jgi:hypothetical protein
MVTVLFPSLVRTDLHELDSSCPGSRNEAVIDVVRSMLFPEEIACRPRFCAMRLAKEKMIATHISSCSSKVTSAE